MINIGIDLGTTNSLIAKCAKGEVEVFKNPTGFKETLPSVVGFRRGSILVGDQARTFTERDPKNVFSRFKRRMGTTESYKVRSLNQVKTPVELSAFVLKELKGFLHTGEAVDAAVITVPASFDTIQSNATKEAGYQAGLKQVVLLQEPIAASLAYANKRKERDLRNSQWLVYDLGGGTFDVALIKIVDGELKVIDHEGDNFLGGTDLDSALVEGQIIPHLQKIGSFADLETGLKSESGKYNALWYKLIHKAEEVKVTLSSKTSADIEFEVEDDDGKEHDVLLTITRSEFESIIKPHVDRTAEMIRTILTRNSLRPGDLQFILMVGGSTLIPCVRSRIGELLQIPVNCEIDPVTAVVVGAASFAGTRAKKIDGGAPAKPVTGRIKLRVSYNRTSQDNEELFAAKVEGNTGGLFYRITRQDGGFDTGLKQLSSRISEDLPLLTDTYNLFAIQILDGENNPIPTETAEIQIAQGKYSVAGQPLSHDICLVLDDLDNESTRLQPLFMKNTILPAKISKQVTVNRTVLKGSKDDILRIIVVEGVAHALPEANHAIGHLVITGQHVSRDIPKGTDIELTIEMSESRDLSVSAYITASDQEFKEIFSPKLRHVPVESLTEEVRLLASKLEQEIAEATESESYETVGELSKLKKTVEELDAQAVILSLDDSTDDRYKLENRKCKLAQDIDALTKDKKIERLRNEYREAKERCMTLVNEHGNDRDKRDYNEIVAQERAFLSSSNPVKIRQGIDSLQAAKFAILRRTPQFLIDVFNSLVEQRERFNDQSQAKSLIESGKAAITADNYDRLREIISGLINLLPQQEKKKMNKSFVGLS